MNTTHYPTNDGASNLASQQLQLSSVTHDWFQALEAGQKVCSIFFDLRKAFDSVPHALSWITSYVTNWK